MTPDLTDSARARIQQKKQLQDQWIVSPEILVKEVFLDPATPYFKSNNFIQNTLSRLCGWDNINGIWRRINVDSQGRLEVSTIQASYDNNDTKSGNAPDAYGAAIAFDDIAKRVDFFIFDNTAIVKRSADGTNWDDEFEIPANMVYNVDGTCHSINIKNKTAGSTARYSIVGWW